MKTEIVAKQYGRNLVVVINGVKKTRVINTPEDKKDAELIKNKVILFNKKNNNLLLEEINYLIDPTLKEKDTIKAKEKGIKKSIKKEIKKETKSKTTKKKDIAVNDLVNTLRTSKLSSDDISQLEEILNKAKGVKEATKASVTETKTRRTGEY